MGNVINEMEVIEDKKLKKLETILQSEHLSLTPSAQRDNYLQIL